MSFLPSVAPRTGSVTAVDVCTNCGTQFTKSTARFCSKCGVKKAAPRKGSMIAGPSPLDPLPKDIQSAAGDRSDQAGDAMQSLLSSTAPTISYRESTTEQSLPRVAVTVNTAEEAKKREKAKKRHSSTVDEEHANSGKDQRKECKVPSADATSSNLTTTCSMEGDLGTLSPSPEEEAQYTVWSTLGPDGLTPEMLQTSNSKDLQAWRKGTLIGRGTYGSVYLGLLPDGCFHAVKCVEIGTRATDHFNVKELVSLSREINMMHRLQHKNLCNFKGVLYDADTTSICMFMEYIGGGSLSTLVKRFKPLPPSVVRSWTKQLLTGLLYLHSQRIIHRDVKGENVLVDTTADPKLESQIKLVDFGAARRLTDAVSQSRTVIGTPYWMAPEVVDMTGEGEGYSYKADVWSVGCTVAEMLTGKPPWPNCSNAPAAIIMIASSPGMPTEIPEEQATPGCLDFMKKCFEREPDRRPTVEELLSHPWIKGRQE